MDLFNQVAAVVILVLIFLCLLFFGWAKIEDKFDPDLEYYFSAFGISAIAITISTFLVNIIYLILNHNAYANRSI